MQQPLIPIEESAGSVLAHLREFVPSYPVSYCDAFRAVERIAGRFLELYAIKSLPVPTKLVSDLPRMVVHVDRSMPALTSGSSVWDSSRRQWIITLNGREPVTRQRFTLMHEFFHILVHRHVERVGLFTHLRPDQVEYLADYFAGCVLVPKSLLRQAWCNGVQQPNALAEVFDVSARAIAVRLDQTRLCGDDLTINRKAVA